MRDTEPGIDGDQRISLVFREALAIAETGAVPKTWPCASVETNRRSLRVRSRRAM